MDANIDFFLDTFLHVREVQSNIEEVSSELRQRGISHDATKFQELEFEAFVSTRERFKKTDYGTSEYQALCDEVKPAMDHHYANNSHHTGYYEDGVNGMTLIDIIEMVADWKAAERRSPNKTLLDTLDYVFDKYSIDSQLRGIIVNTLQYLGWVQ